MAGKRVRCKQCGNIFALPDAALEDGSSDLDALAELEKSYHSVDATGAGGTSLGDEMGDPQDGDDSPVPLREGRSNPRFVYPFAKDVDVWLPRVLAVGAAVWLGWACFQYNETSAKWMPYVRLVVGLLAYAGFIAPLTHGMIRRAARQLRYQVPTASKWRAFASYFPAFVMGCVLWTVGGGYLSGLLLGCVAGVILSTIALWLLFRLQPSEIAPTATYALVGFFLGLAIVGGIYFGVNVLLLQIINATKNPDLLPASPFGPGMAWISQDDRERLLAEAAKTKTPKAVASNPDNATTSAPPVPAALSPIVKSIDAAPLNGTFDDMLAPLTESPFRAILRASGSNTSVEVWDTQSWKQIGQASFAKGADPNEARFVLSPDGKMVGRISRFPRLSAQIWSFATNQVAHSIPIEDHNVTPELMGFIDANRLLLRWQKDTGCTFEIYDVQSGSRIRNFDTPAFDHQGTTFAISRSAVQAAIATRVDNKPTLLIYSFETGKQIISVPINPLDPHWPVTPTGMAFSLDAKQLAVLFEQSGNGLLLDYQLDLDKGEGKESAQWVYPAGPVANRESPNFGGSSVQWLPDGDNWLIYGQAIFNRTTGRKIEEIQVPLVEASRISPPNKVELVIRASDGQRQLKVVNLDVAKIASLSK